MIVYRFCAAMMIIGGATAFWLMLTRPGMPALDLLALGIWWLGWNTAWGCGMLSSARCTTGL
jgi:hypothetical protein